MTRAWAARAARELWTPLILGGALFITYYLISEHGSTFYRDIAARFFVYVIIVLALQIFSGNSGVLSFGHVAFVAVGAYTSALLTIPQEIKDFTFLTMPGFLKYWIFPAELSPTWATLAGGGFAALFALIMAFPIVRLTGIAGGIGTLAILVFVNVFIVQTTSITRGTSTMIGVPNSTTLKSLFIWSLVFVVIAYAYRRSRRGLRLQSTRENDRAARSVGISVPVERGVAFVLSGFVAGVAGALYGHYFVTFSPYDFYFDLTFLTIAMLVVGGMSSVTGGIVGTFFLTMIFTAFQRVEVNGFFDLFGDDKPPSGTANLVMAVALLLTMIFRPRGIMGYREVPWPGDLIRRGRKPEALEREKPEPAADTQPAADASPGASGTAP
jgi:branched-chain amino acid transport system permease protein